MKLTMAFAGVYLIAVIALTGSSTPIAAQGQQTQWDGVFTDAQARRGGELYKVVCEYCHGPDLEGGSGGADVGPELKGQNFLASWNKKTANDLFTLIVKSMPQDRPGSVTPQETADLVAFVLLKNGAPAGKTELAPQPDALNSISLAPEKP